MAGGLTAHFAIGDGELDRVRIGPAWTMWLYEHHRPMWIFQPLTTAMGGINEEPNPFRAHWVPNPDHILDDGMLLIAMHALRYPDIRAEGEAIEPRLLEPRELDQSGALWLTEIPTEAMDRLRAMATAAEWGSLKIAVSVFGRCAISDSLPLLDRYSAEMVLTTPAWSRRRNVEWRDGDSKLRTRGTLTFPEEIDMPSGPDPPLVG